jgi:hypothetical protein
MWRDMPEEPYYAGLAPPLRASCCFLNKLTAGSDLDLTVEVLAPVTSDADRRPAARKSLSPLLQNRTDRKGRGPGSRVECILGESHRLTNGNSAEFLFKNNRIA